MEDKLILIVKELRRVCDFLRQSGEFSDELIGEIEENTLYHEDDSVFTDESIRPIKFSKDTPVFGQKEVTLPSGIPVSVRFTGEVHNGVITNMSPPLSAMISPSTEVAPTEPVYQKYYKKKIITGPAQINVDAHWSDNLCEDWRQIPETRADIYRHRDEWNHDYYKQVEIPYKVVTEEKLMQTFGCVGKMKDSEGRGTEIETLNGLSGGKLEYYNTTQEMRYEKNKWTVRVPKQELQTLTPANTFTIHVEGAEIVMSEKDITFTVDGKVVIQAWKFGGFSLNEKAIMSDYNVYKALTEFFKKAGISLKNKNNYSGINDGF